MSKSLLGDLCAYIPKRPGQEKPSYPRVGSAFIDSDTQRISLKIDTMPIPGSGWEGWLNVFPRERGEKPSTKSADIHFTSDDVPF